MKTGIERIADERNRQITELGFKPEYDDGDHVNSELSEAAILYAETANTQARGGCGWETMPESWPWHPEFWKPSADPIRNLTKAGALIAAEIDRLQRRDSICETCGKPMHSDGPPEEPIYICVPCENSK